MATYEEFRAAKDVIQVLLKAKKAIRMYPTNNPIYTKTIDDAYLKFGDFFHYQNDLDLRIKQNEILLDSEPLYHNPDKDDNLALFFFKDGLRELIFKRGLARGELEEFLRIISQDFDRETVDDDIVTLLWEKDFQDIKYVVDEAFLLEDDTYESRAVAEVKEKAADTDELLKAYAEAFQAEDVQETAIVSLTDKDLQSLVREIDRDVEEKTGKLADILFEMLFQSESGPEFDDICTFIKDLIEHSLRQGDLKGAITILHKARQIVETPASPEPVKTQMHRITSIVNLPESVTLIGAILDSAEPADEQLIAEYVQYLDRGAITPFVGVLGDMQSIHGRKQVIQILVSISKKDIQTLAKGLNDSRWYLVRNIIYILRHIGDKKAVEYLLSSTKHADPRVRKEAIKALGELKSALALPTLRECLDDADSSVRRLAAKSLGSLGSEGAKRILIEKIDHRDFRAREFDEKMEFCEALAHWNDRDVADFFLRILKRRNFFKRAPIEEAKACAAHALGIMGNRDALPTLTKLKGSKTKLLKEHAVIAARRIEHGG